MKSRNPLLVVLPLAILLSVAFAQDSRTERTYFQLPEMAALRGLTVNAARMLMIEDRVGTLEPGKDADIAVWTGDPFDPRSRTQVVLVSIHQVECHLLASCLFLFYCLGLTGFLDMFYSQFSRLLTAS